MREPARASRLNMDHPKRILIVEDDVDIANVLSLHLRDERYEVVHSADGNEGLRLLAQGNWDALILDLMLPGVDGLEICRRARAMTRYTPIWGYQHEGYEHTVNTHINRLRTKIEADPAQPSRILTVWGHGYKLAAGTQGGAP